MRAVCFSLLICLGACAEFPSLDDRISPAARDAPFPKLTSLRPLLDQANSAQTITNSVQTDIASRITRLTARADALRDPVIAAPTRARMRRGIDSSALR